MKVSLQWLKSLVFLPPELTSQDIAQKLTMAGLEVEGIISIARNLTGTKVVEVRGKRKHPQADKLNLVDVFDGTSITQVVCGASNVPEPGSSDKVVWAPPGATLPSGVTLSAKEVRGVISPGMLCSQVELGIAENAEGLLLLRSEDGFPVGSDFAKYAGLPDEILDINVTANRSDCLGHVGIARELAALFAQQGAKLTFPQKQIRYQSKSTNQFVSVVIQNSQDCYRYQATLLENVQVKESPLPIRLLLERLGLRPVSNIVDATQLAMLEWGQPIHAFDFDKITGDRIFVQRAKEQGTLAGLDGGSYTLSSEDLVISDSQKTMALAGVIGSTNSQVDQQTKRVLLESAYFQPDLIRQTAKRLKIQTDASYRFERGTDPNLGLEQATGSFLERVQNLCPEVKIYQSLDSYVKKEFDKTLILDPNQVSSLLGTMIPNETQKNLLLALGLQVKEVPEGLQVSIPTFRLDLKRTIDLVEEIARLYGYQHIPETIPAYSLASIPEFLEKMQEKYQVSEKARDLCVSLGLFEIQTLPFTSAVGTQVLRFAHTDRRSHSLRLSNPLQEEMSHLRTQLILMLLEAASHNLSHGQKSIRLFEVAEVYLSKSNQENELAEELTKVAGVLVGTRKDGLKEEPFDFYDLRGIVEELILGLYGKQISPGKEIEILPAHGNKIPWLHPGVSAKIVIHSNNQWIGELGEVHPDIRHELKIEAPVFAFEILLPTRLPITPIFQPWSKFPQVSRDLSFYCDESIPAGDLIRVLERAGEPLFKGALILDDYREPGKVPIGKKGLLFRLLYQSEDHTLREEEIQKAHDSLLQTLHSHFVVEFR